LASSEGGEVALASRTWPARRSCDEFIVVWAPRRCGMVAHKRHAFQSPLPRGSKRAGFVIHPQDNNEQGVFAGNPSA
jgi:hypothetical protein